MSVAHDYPLARNDAEYTRLAEQAAFWSADAAALFASAGIEAGAHVADLGCGTPHVAAQLAECVGPHGTVRAVDNDAGLVGAMAARPRARPWLTVECGDAFDTRWPAASLDAVHARFLAAPAGRLDALICEMRRVVRPGGVLMLQEPIADSWSLPGAGTAWQRVLGLIRAGFAQRGGDFDAGRAVADRLRNAGASKVHTRSVVHHLPPGHPYARLPLYFCDALSALWRASGLAQADEIDALRKRLAEVTTGHGPATTTFTLVQAWALR